MLKAELTRRDVANEGTVAIECSENDGSCFLLIKLQMEGEYSLALTFCGQHIPNSPFFLLVNNRDYYCTTFKQPGKTIDIASPHHIAFSSNGDIFVTCTSTHSVHVYDKQHGKRKMEKGRPGNGDLECKDPAGIALSGNVVYVADGSNHRIQKFSTDGIFLNTFGSHISDISMLSFQRALQLFLMQWCMSVTGAMIK